MTDRQELIIGPMQLPDDEDGFKQWFRRSRTQNRRRREFARHAQHILARGQRAPESAGFAGYTAENGAEFDGTNDDMLRGADFTGNSDGKEYLISLWFKLAAGASGTRVIYNSRSAAGPQGVLLQWNGSVIQLFARNAAEAIISRVQSVVNLSGDTDWHHLLVSANLASAGSTHMYLDDAAEETAITETNDTINFTIAEHAIGRLGHAALQRWSGCLGEIYLNLAESMDITVEANRRKFISAAGKPVDLGSDGSTPTGTAPIGYWNNPFDSFETNKGSGGGMTVTGALADCGSSPSD